ncbi:MAG: hypothetical protein OXB88_06055 [Bacteriovoracales bacterium]|nr:hypothetical protein [Bacteriovoracales bacterium]
MFRLDLKSKTLEELEEETLDKNNLSERGDLQQWVKSNPEVISKHFEFDLKIIAEEYNGFEVNDRPDLLAVDEEGALVVIEIKRGHSGSRIDFQALKYASYCSSLGPEEIIEIYAEYLKKENIDKDARDDLFEFVRREIDGNDSEDYEFSELNRSQKIILLAENFDGRIKSVVAWLANQDIDISCIKFSLCKDGDTFYLDSQKILPHEPIESHLIGNAPSSHIGKHPRVKSQPPEVLEFFEKIKQALSEKHDLYARSYKGYKYILFGAGKVELNFAFDIRKKLKAYEIRFECKKNEIPILRYFDELKPSLKWKHEYEIETNDPKKDHRSKYQRVFITHQPSESEYMKDADSMADLIKDFMDYMNPVVERSKK